MIFGLELHIQMYGHHNHRTSKVIYFNSFSTNHQERWYRRNCRQSVRRVETQKGLGTLNSENKTEMNGKE